VIVPQFSLGERRERDEIAFDRRDASLLDHAERPSASEESVSAREQAAYGEAWCG